MADEQGHQEDWEVVWERSGHAAEIDGDLVVSLLEGSDIPVVRIPPGPVLFDGFGGPLLPVKVLVPPQHAADARALIEEAAIDTGGFEESEP